MEVKKLILFMERQKLKSEEVYSDEIDQVIALLQQGEALKEENVELRAYKEMWEGFLDLPLGYFVRPSDWELYLFRLRELEEKFFPDRESQIKEV